MKKMLGGQKFASDTKLQSTNRQWLRQQAASFFCRLQMNLDDTLKNETLMCDV